LGRRTCFPAPYSEFYYTGHDFGPGSPKIGRSADGILGPFEEFDTYAFDKDNKQYYIATNKGDDRDLKQLVLLDPVSMKETFVEKDPMNRVDFGGANFSDVSKTIILTSYTDEKERLYWKDKQFEADYKTELLGERLLATPQHYAYLKISEGCNRTCAFCAIPLMRGGHISKTIEEIVKEAEGLVRRGVKEVMLIAQELTYYGLDIYKKRMLPDLLHRLADVKGLQWIRLHYAYPSKFPLEILDVMRERENICNYLDMPLQHAANNMLKAMKRQITREEMEELIVAVREKVPGICLRTTLIAGFPGETQDDVEELKMFLQKQRFDRVGIFTYSHEEGTSAHDLIDDVPADEKERRAQEVMEVQQEISYELNQQKIGKIFKTIIDKKEAGRYLGRTEFDSVEVDNEVVIHSSKKLPIGDFVNVKITKAYDYDIEGEVI